VDPVEKKPLFHFLPGTLSFSLATSGCVFRCLNCQNWEISQKKPEATKDPRGEELRLKPPLPSSLSLEQMSRLSLFPEDVVAVTEALGCPSISYTYSEPVAFYEYTQDTCQAARARKLKNIVGGLRKRSAKNAWNSKLPQTLFEKPALRVPHAAMRRASLITFSEVDQINAVPAQPRWC